MEGGPPTFRQDYTCPALLEDPRSALPVRGYHPLWPVFPEPFRFHFPGRWPGPRSLATTNGVSVDVLSSGYLDVSVRRVRLAWLWIHHAIPHKAVGCPIRKSPDQSLLATPQGLSQRATSFIASTRQGIRQMPFSRLNLNESVMRRDQSDARRVDRVNTNEPTPMGRPSVSCIAVFTMTKNDADYAIPWMRNRKLHFTGPGLPLRRPAVGEAAGLVEVNGVEPSTSCLQSRRSPN